MWAKLATSARLLKIQVGAMLLVLAVLVYDNRLVAADVPCDVYDGGFNQSIRMGVGLGSLAIGALLLVVRLVAHLRRREPRRLLAVLGLGAVEALLVAFAFQLLVAPHVLHCWRLDLEGDQLNPCAMGLCAH
jgi:hypothetical protein